LTKTRMLGLLAGDTTSPGIDITGDPNTLRSLLGGMFPILLTPI